MFPQGLPGLGLLCLRLAAVAGAVLHRDALSAACGQTTMLAAVGAIVTALCIGLWTPWAALACCVLAVWSLASPSTGAPAWVSPMFALLALALALLGPGAYSVDARLFGRRRLRITIRGK